MSHIPYFGQEAQSDLTEAVNKLERAMQVYALLVLGDDMILNESLSDAERINNVAEFLKSIV